MGPLAERKRLAQHKAASERWIQRIFEAKAASNGGVVHRNADDVKKFASVDDLKAEVKRRDFHMVFAGGQYVIICRTGEYRTIC